MSGNFKLVTGPQCIIFAQSLLLLLSKGGATYCPRNCNCTFVQGSVHCSSATDNVEEIWKLTHYERVREFVMRRSSIEFVPSFKKSANSITELDLSCNKVKSIGTELSSLHSLKYLNLSYNLIESVVGGALRNARNLSRLDLSNNRLEYLPMRLLRQAKELKHLDLSHNNLRVIPPRLVEEAIHLQYVYFNNNDLKTIHSSTFVNNADLRRVFLADNPWDCNCGLIWLRESIVVEPYLRESSEIMCSTPIRLHSIKIGNLSYTDLECMPPEIHSEEQERTLSVKRGSSFFVHCNATGYPNPSVAWLAPSGETLIHSANQLWLSSVLVAPRATLSVQITSVTNRASRVTVLQNGSLHIEHIEKYFAGLYTCVAINPAGNVTMYINVMLDSHVEDIVLTSMWIGCSVAGAFLCASLVFGAVRLCCDRCCKKPTKKSSIYSQPSVVNATPWAFTPGGSPWKFSTPSNGPSNESEDEEIHGLLSINDCSFDSSEPQSTRLDTIKETLDEVKIRLREHVGRTKEDMRRKMQRVRQSGSQYMQSIRESSSQAANRVKTGVVLGVEQVKYHVKSMKELCGTGDIGQTISTISIVTDIDSSEVTALEKKHTLV